MNEQYKIGTEVFTNSFTQNGIFYFDKTRENKSYVSYRKKEGDKKWATKQYQKQQRKSARATKRKKSMGNNNA